MDMQSHQPKTEIKSIFLAEDDIDDQEFLTEALKSLDDNITVHVESSGEKAVLYLQNLPDGQTPCLIILDYNLPLVSGHQILQNISQWDRYKDITKVVWSTSNSPHYEQVCLQSGASAYFVKPSDIAGIHQLAKKMLELCS
jgi:CheY-like chemotaxis protein